MAVKLPNGATVHIATALAAEKKATVATNADGSRTRVCQRRFGFV